MNPNKALWEKGDFTRIAATMRESGEALVDSFGITKGLKVLDLGCGDGTTALPAAALGADVLGVDIAKNLVEAGNRRAREHKLSNCTFQEGDASNLEQLEDKSFDLVVSIFGAMFAPKPFDVANEMVRVTRHGGRIIMGNWIPNDPTLVAQILKISAAYTAAAAGRIRQPHDMGCRRRGDIAIYGGGGSEAQHLLRKGHLQLQLSRPTVAIRRRLPLLLRADHERLRSGGGQRSSRRTPNGAGGAVRQPEHEPEPGRHPDSGDLPARDRRAGVRCCSETK